MTAAARPRPSRFASWIGPLTSMLLCASTLMVGPYAGAATAPSTSLSIADRQTKAQLDWLVAIADKHPTDEVLRGHIAAIFLQANPPEGLRMLLAQWSGSRPLRLDSVSLDPK